MRGEKICDNLPRRGGLFWSTGECQGVDKNHRETALTPFQRRLSDTTAWVFDTRA